jgi:hypothetical protein
LFRVFPAKVAAMMLKPALVAAALSLIALPARADWLDRAWDGDATARTGAPAITLNNSGVLLVLPEATLAEARAAGVDTHEAVQLFVRRYAQLCSEMLDLDRTHQDVRVTLFTSKPVPLEDASEATQGEILEALKSSGSKKLPRVETLFVVSPEHRDLVINYVPSRKASCIRPGVPVS